MIKELFELTPAIYGREDEIEMLPQLRANGGGELYDIRSRTRRRVCLIMGEKSL